MKKWCTQKREPKAPAKHKGWQEVKDLSTPQQNFLKELIRCQILALIPCASRKKKKKGSGYFHQQIKRAHSCFLNSSLAVEMEAEIGPEKETGRKSGKELTKGVEERRKSASEMNYACHSQIYLLACGEASEKPDRMSEASCFFGSNCEFANQWSCALWLCFNFLCPKRKANKNPRAH